MATITISVNKDIEVPQSVLKGIGRIDRILTVTVIDTLYVDLIIPRMSSTRFENVVKRVLTKNLKEQGITPIDIKYSE